MKLSKKMLLFGILFSVVFFLLRTKDPFYGKILMADIDDLGGITYLYSTVGIIFSILAGFIIQNRWERWNNLVLAVKGEVAALKELWSWSKQCPAPVMASIHKSIQDYLSVVIQEGWEKPAGEDEGGAGEMVLASLRNGVLEAHLQPHLAASVFSIFADILTYRTKRLYHMRPMPESLQHMFVFATTLVIGLALFIGVKNLWLDYLFTVSIGLLGYLIYLVVDDLDNPMKPGIWHMTLKDYQQLLRRFQHSEPDAPAARSS